MQQSQEKKVIDLTSEITDLNQIFTEEKKPEVRPSLITAYYSKQDILSSTPHTPPPKSDLNQKTLGISEYLHQTYSDRGAIDLEESYYNIPYIFKNFKESSKPSFPKDVSEIINSSNSARDTYKTKPENISSFEKFKEKNPERRVLPFPSMGKLNKLENKEQSALSQLRKWKNKEIASELKIPDKRTRDQEDEKNGIPVKKKKDPKAENKEFLSQHNHQTFQVMDFIKEQQARVEEEKKNKVNLADELKKKEIEQREYQRIMKNADFSSAVQISDEEVKRRAYMIRYNTRFELSSFYHFILNTDVYNLTFSGSCTEIPTKFSDGAVYIQAFESAFFEEVKGEILSALRQNDMSEFCTTSLSVHSEKDGFGFLVSRDDRDQDPGRFRFNYRVQNDDILLIIPNLSDFKDTEFKHNFSDWKMHPDAILGIVERKKGSNYSELQIKIRHSHLSVFETQPKCYIFIIDTCTTILREYKMIRLAEFLEVKDQIFDPRRTVFQKRSSVLEDFVSAIERYHNDSQLDCIARASSVISGIVLLQGPPGTGKTHTIKGIISAILRKEQEESGAIPYVLVCAPSNSAIDEIANRVATDKLYDINGKPRDDVKLLRVGNNPRKSAGDIREKLKKDAKETPAKVQEMSLGALVSKLVTQGGTEDGNKQIDKLLEDIKIIDISLQKAREKKNKGLTISLEEQRSKVQKSLFQAKQSNKTLKDKRRECEDGILNTSHIVFSTLSAAGSKEMLSIRHPFDYVIIDEACQCVELSSLIPLQFGSKVAILVGDPKQLPATTFCYNSNRNLYSRSLFERLMQGGSKVDILTIQYRMIPDICDFPSMYFYDNRLETFEDLKQESVPSWIGTPGLLFIDLKSSAESRNSSETSISNTKEAEFIGKLYTMLKPLHGSRLGIGIITPYKKQSIIIKEYLNRFYEEDWKIDVEVNTIDGFQGREKDVIIFSAVRTGETIGFLADARRMNVAITRARYALWIVGKLECLQKNQEWNELIIHCKNVNKVVSCMEFREVQDRFEPKREYQERSNKVYFHKRKQKTREKGVGHKNTGGNLEPRKVFETEKKKNNDPVKKKVDSEKQALDIIHRFI